MTWVNSAASKIRVLHITLILFIFHNFLKLIYKILLKIDEKNQKSQNKNSYSKAIKANEEVHNAKEKKKAIIFNRLFMS